MSAPPTFDGNSSDGSFLQLLNRLRAADEAACREAFDKLLPQVSLELRRKFGAEVGPAVDQSGAAQSAWVTIYRRIVAGEFELNNWDDLAGLLITTAANKCRRMWRKGRREVHFQDVAVPGNPEEPPKTLDPEAPGRSQADELIHGEAVAELRRAQDALRHHLTRVHADYLPIFRLLMEQKYSMREIRERVGCSESKVHRVRKYVYDYLRTRLDESLKDDLAS